MKITKSIIELNNEELCFAITKDKDGIFHLYIDGAHESSHKNLYMATNYLHCFVNYELYRKTEGK